MNVSEWLEQKYASWEQAQGGRQSYYLFARYLDVSHTALAQWLNGISEPAGDDLAKLAGKLGSEIFRLAGSSPAASPSPLVPGPSSHLPSALRQRLADAIQECEQVITSQKLDPESPEAKRLAVKIFDKWGFRITG